MRLSFIPALLAESQASVEGITVIVHGSWGCFPGPYISRVAMAGDTSWHHDFLQLCDLLSCVTGQLWEINAMLIG
jgi:hypothetical protein